MFLVCRVGSWNGIMWVWRRGSRRNWLTDVGNERESASGEGLHWCLLITGTTRSFSETISVAERRNIGSRGMERKLVMGFSWCLLLCDLVGFGHCRCYLVSRNCQPQHVSVLGCVANQTMSSLIVKVIRRAREKPHLSSIADLHSRTTPHCRL
jgi:hypothetical protein